MGFLLLVFGDAWEEAFTIEGGGGERVLHLSEKKKEEGGKEKREVRKLKRWVESQFFDKVFSIFHSLIG